MWACQTDRFYFKAVTLVPVGDTLSNGRFSSWPGRLAWIGVALPVIWLTFAGIPYRYRQLVGQNQWFQSELGLHMLPEQAAWMVLFCELLISAMFFIMGALLIWLKGHSFMGTVAAFAFLAAAATMSGMTDAVIDETMTTRWLDMAWFVYTLRALSSTFSILLFYLLPDGRFYPKWTKALTPVWILLNVGWLLFPRMPFNMVYGETFRATETASILVATAWWGTGIAAQVARFRHTTDSVVRRQIFWVAFGLGSAGFGYISYLVLRPLHTWLEFSSDLYVVGRPIVSTIGFVLLPICITIAILRYRLFDIDVLINRTLVYGTLTAVTIAIYVLMVGGVGSLLQTQSGAAIAFLATGVVAVLFQPLRLRLQTAVDRLMYGQRDDPVGMLTQLAQRLEAADSPDSILPTLVETIAVALKLPYVALWLPASRSQWQLAAAFGRLADDLQMLPLLYQNHEIGRLFVAPRGPGERFSREDERLLATIAQLSATTVQAAHLSTELQQSRRQIITSREEERRRLRRDLHDGLGPVLAAVALQADTARDLTDADPAETRAILNSIMEQAQTAVGEVRRLVYDLRPPALDELGLAGALRQSIQPYQHQIAITLDTPELLPPLPAAVEVAAYRIVQEAVNNVVKHARAATCAITFTIVTDGDRQLSLLIEDDGIGLPDTAVSGVGLISMQERAAELGGRCTVRRRAEGGTRVQAFLPLPVEEQA